MDDRQAGISRFNVLAGEALRVKTVPFGSVGTVTEGHGVEVVWVAKQDEAIDPDWYSQPQLDVLFVVRGTLRVEFAHDPSAVQTLTEGQLIVIPPSTKCRAYRWPRDAVEPTIFLAITPENPPVAQDKRAAP
jgi:quercetin dioxygenase-like cupin family protein